MSRLLYPQDDNRSMANNTFEVFHNYSDQPITWNYHTHDFYEVLIFLSGHVDYSVEDKTYLLKPGDIVLTNNQELHRARILDNTPYDRFVAWFHPAFFDTLNYQSPGTNMAACFDSSSKNHYNLLHADSETFHDIVRLFKKLMHPITLDEFGSSMLRNCYAAELLILLNRAYQNTTLTPGIHVITNPKVNDIVFYINQNLCEDLSLDALSKRFFISKYYLTRLFKQYTGLSLHQYVLNKRLITAKTLLINGAKPYEACLDAGFSNYSHFSKAFKDAFSVTPSDYGKL